MIENTVGESRASHRVLKVCGLGRKVLGIGRASRDLTSLQEHVSDKGTFTRPLVRPRPG